MGYFIKREKKYFCGLNMENCGQFNEFWLFLRENMFWKNLKSHKRHETDQKLNYFPLQRHFSGNQLSERSVRKPPHFDDIDWEQNPFICDIWDMVSNTSVSDAQIFTNTTLDACTLKYEDYVWPNSSRESLESDFFYSCCWQLFFQYFVIGRLTLFYAGLPRKRAK